MACACPICFDEITAETGKCVLSCSHTYHFSCIVDWFSTQVDMDVKESCPSCRHIAGEKESLPVCNGEAVSEHDEDDDEDEDEDEDDVEEQSFGKWRRVGDAAWVCEKLVLNPEEDDGVELWKTGEGLPPQSLMFAMESSTAKIQALWRGYKVRNT